MLKVIRRMVLSNLVKLVFLVVVFFMFNFAADRDAGFLTVNLAVDDEYAGLFRVSFTDTGVLALLIFCSALLAIGLYHDLRRIYKQHKLHTKEEHKA